MPKESCNYILEANLFDAIQTAILYYKDKEASVSPTFCSTFRAGLEANLEAMKRGERLKIR